MSYEPAGWFVDMVDQRIPALVEHTRANGHDAVQLANIFLDPSTGDGDLTPQRHVEMLALLAALMVRRLARADAPL